MSENKKQMTETKDHWITTDQSRTEEHEEITWDLILLVEHDPGLKELLRKSIRKAKESNPDPDTNPVDSLTSYYAFIDRIVKAMPWQIVPSDTYSSLYDKINQGMGLLYFVCNQSLEELEGCGYFHNSLQYHEPFRSWLVKLLSVNGTYLNTEDSWKEEYYQNALKNPDFHLDDGTFEDPSNWHCFNDFFARALRDPSLRPIYEPDDPRIVIAPTDSLPAGSWQIDADSKIIAEYAEQRSISIKTGKLTDVSVLLKGSSYANAFAKGTITHTFLDINDYHRYHFPVTGTIKEVLMIPQDDAAGGVIIWDDELKLYVEYYSEILGWQSIETRGVVVVEMEGGGLAAIVCVGMCQVSSVNFEETVVPGAHVKKGDLLGRFLFGGSDIIMIFDQKAAFTMTAKPNVHQQLGEEYGRLG